MEKKKTLYVTAKYGSLEFSDWAWPYDPFNHSYQVESCKKGVIRKIVDAGLAEMLDAFTWSLRVM